MSDITLRNEKLVEGFKCPFCASAPRSGMFSVTGRDGDFRCEIICQSCHRTFGSVEFTDNDYDRSDPWD